MKPAGCVQSDGSAIESFGGAVQTYESYGFIQRQMAAWLAEWLPPTPEGTAVEVAAGTGFFTHYLQNWESRLLATDASAAMVDSAKARLPGPRWQTARADALPDVSADWIFSSSFLQWSGDPAEMLRHWASRLRPGGKVLAGLYVAPTLPELNEILPRASPLQWRGPAEWDAAIAASGLRLLRAASSHRLFIFPSALQLMRTLHRTGTTPNRRTTPARLRSAIAEYDRRYSLGQGVRSTWTFHRFEAIRPSADP
jgi:SAM-dependent methyltransferase